MSYIQIVLDNMCVACSRDTLRQSQLKLSDIIIKNILNIIPWTRSKEYFINALINDLQSQCSNCQKIIVLKEQSLRSKFRNIYLKIKTQRCNWCIHEN